LAERERPAGRLLVLEPEAHLTKPIMLTEFGGIACAPGAEETTWGYSRARDPEELADLYASLIVAVRSLHRLAGFCYTQFADTYQEANGLLYADRTPKFPLEEIAMLTTGGERERHEGIEPKWRDRLMRAQMELEQFRRA
jgi:hypothetical protein